MKLGPGKFFCLVTPKNRGGQQHQLRNQRQLRLRNSLVVFYPQKATPYNETFEDLCKLETLGDVEE